MLKQLAPYKNLVVSTGGGAVMRPLNWSHMHMGVVVWLQGPTELLAGRVAKEGLSKRPLLAEGLQGAAEEVTEEQLFSVAKSKLDSILAARAAHYDSADLKVRCVVTIGMRRPSPTAAAACMRTKTQMQHEKGGAVQV